MRRTTLAMMSLFLMLGLAAPGWAAAEFTSDFLLESCSWSAWGRQNPYFSLRPGRQLVPRSIIVIPRLVIALCRLV